MLAATMLEFPLLCRLCGLKTENGLYIYCDEGKRRQVETKIRLYLHFQVLPSDSLPKKICASCFDELEGMHRFAINALKVQDNLSRLSKELPRTATDVCKSFMTNYVNDAVTMNDAIASLTTQEVTEMEVQVDPMVFLEDDQIDEVTPENHQELEKGTAEPVESDQQNLSQGVEDVNTGNDTALNSLNDVSFKEENEENVLANVDKQNAIIDKCCDQQQQTDQLVKKEAVEPKIEVEAATPVEQEQAQEPKLEPQQPPTISVEKDNEEASPQNGKPIELPIKVPLQVPKVPETEKSSKEKRSGTVSKVSKKVEPKAVSTDNSKNATFTCPICKKIFSRRGIFRTHLETHKSDQKYACEICMRVFKKETNLVRHRKSHSELTIYPCSYCSRVYPTKSTLRSHLVSHSDERPHVCTICSKSFKRNQDLKFHLNQHNGLRPYHCPYCTKAFASSGNCFSHRRRAHMQEIERDRAQKNIGISN